MRTVVAPAESSSSSGGSSGNGASSDGASSSNGASSGSGAAAEAYTSPGVAVNSACSSSGLSLDGLPTDQAKAAAIDWLEQQGIGHRQVGGRLGLEQRGMPAAVDG